MSLKVNQLQIESENEECPYIWFSMGIDHSNPYIHSTTVLCDKKKMKNMGKNVNSTFLILRISYITD